MEGLQIAQILADLSDLQNTVRSLPLCTLVSSTVKNEKVAISYGTDVVESRITQPPQLS